VRKAFQTELHNLDVNGEKHIANMNDPAIPAALRSSNRGLWCRCTTSVRTRWFACASRVPNLRSLIFSGGANYAVTPSDLATIYNFNPLFSSGISGQGQTIVLIEDTMCSSASDWSAVPLGLRPFRYNSASFTQAHPAPSSGTNNCGAPGVIAPNDAEAILDAEWASAAAPSAAIEMAACADTQTTFGA